MYKIYINETPLFLLSSEEAAHWEAPGKNSMRAWYPGKNKLLLGYIDMMEKSKRFDSVVLYSEDSAKLVEDFFSIFQIIEAAGGVVFNREGKVLLIFRRAFWDLPKGKIDPGEKIEQSAIREVREETGLKEVNLGDFLGKTFHTFRKGKKRILKQTHWFLMDTPETQLLPQKEEDIEVASWFDVKEFLAMDRVVYGNIKDLLKKVEGLKQ